MSAFAASVENSHWFIGRPRLHLEEICCCTITAPTTTILYK